MLNTLESHLQSDANTSPLAPHTTLSLGEKLPRVTYNSGEKTETEVQLFLGIANTFLRLPPGGRWCGKPGYASTSQSSPVDNINPDSKK